jgi:hypothetical protein
MVEVGSFQGTSMERHLRNPGLERVHAGSGELGAGSFLSFAGHTGDKKAFCTTGPLLASALALAVGFLLACPLMAAPADTLSLKDFMLTGRLERAPIKDLLLELSSKAGFELQTVGPLDQLISLSFRDRPLIEGLRDMMRLAGVSFVIIQSTSGETNTQGRVSPVQTLLVFDIRGSPPISGQRPEQGGTGPTGLDGDAFSGQEAELEHGSQPSETNASERHAFAEAEFEGTREDLENFVQSLAANQTITREDYELLMEEIK